MIQNVDKNNHHELNENLLIKLDQWFDSELGREILCAQQHLVNEALVNCFGYHLLQLSALSNTKFYVDCGVQRQYRCHPMASNHHAYCDFDQLPFDTESLDAVIVHHAHEFMENPHRLIRELQRVIAPRGHLIIVGFNPWSPLGGYSLIRRLFPNSIWHNQMISHRRVKDWLNLIGFEVTVESFGSHSPRFINKAKKPWLKLLLKSMPVGNFYVISGIKQQANLTPIKPKWSNAKKAFGGLAPIKPRVSSQKVYKLTKNNKENIT